MTKTYNVNINLGVQIEANDSNEAMKQVYDFLQEVVNSGDLTEDEIEIMEVE